jgi:hypothetical protein
MDADRGTGIGRSGRRGRIVVALVLAVLALTVSGARAAMADVLLGSQAVGGNLDSNSPGSAEAFGITATTTGTVESLTVYLDATSQAAKVVAGLYTDNAGRPGSLLTQGTTTAPVPGAWNQITVPAVAVTTGSKYWISVLGPTGTGQIRFRDTPSGSRSESSSQSNLTSLPATWSAGPDWNNSPISAYASGVALTGPVLLPPAAPTGVAATAGNASANVNWTAPSDGGSPITSYTVTSYVGSTAQAATTVVGSPPATGVTIGGLTNGIAYTFTVTATNAIGTGPPSAQSNAVTPTAALTAPVIDLSTPAISAVSNNVTTIVSNSFSPPGASIIYIAVTLDSQPYEANAHVASVTNSGSALTWHLKGSANQIGPGVGGFVEVWWAYNPTAQTNITVTCNLAQPTKNVTPPIGALQVIVLRNAAADQSSAAWTPTWDVNGGSAPNATVTTTAPNSLVFAVANNWDSSVTPTMPADQTPTINGQAAEVLNPIDRDTYWVQVEKAPTAVAGPVTMSDSAPSVRYHMVAWEVLAQ